MCYLEFDNNVSLCSIVCIAIDTFCRVCVSRRNEGRQIMVYINLNNEDIVVVLDAAAVDNVGSMRG